MSGVASTFLKRAAGIKSHTTLGSQHYRSICIYFCVSGKRGTVYEHKRKLQLWWKNLIDMARIIDAFQGYNISSVGLRAARFFLFQWNFAIVTYGFIVRFSIVRLYLG